MLQNCSGVRSGATPAGGGGGGSAGAPPLAVDEAPPPPAEEEPAALGAEAAPALADVAPPELPPATAPAMPLPETEISLGVVPGSAVLTGSPHALSATSPSSLRMLRCFRKRFPRLRVVFQSRAARPSRVKNERRAGLPRLDV
jgi:hypothetical protein